MERTERIEALREGVFLRHAGARLSWCRLIWCTRYAVDDGLCAEHGSCWLCAPERQRVIFHVHIERPERKAA